MRRLPFFLVALIFFACAPSSQPLVAQSGPCSLVGSQTTLASTDQFLLETATPASKCITAENLSSGVLATCGLSCDPNLTLSNTTRSTDFQTDENLLRLRVQLEDSVGDLATYSQMRTQRYDGTVASEDASWALDVVFGGVMKSVLEYLIDGSNMPGIFINEDGEDWDFRVESDTLTHALFVQGSDGRIGINTSSPEAPLHVEAGSGSLPSILAGTAGIFSNTGGNLFLSLISDTSGNIQIFLGDDDAQIDGRIVYSNANRELGLWAAGSEKVTIDGTLVTIDPEVQLNDTNTGSNAGTDLCIDANGKICACGSCA